MNFAEALAYALTLTDTVRAPHYGAPAAKVNGRAFLATGHEADTSFVVLIDRATVDLLMATEPETYWQTPHYAGHAAVLVRYDAADETRVRATIREAHAQAAAAKPARPRRK